MPILTNCQTCGNDIYSKPSRIKQGKGKFCSRVCHGKSLVGDKNPCWRGGKEEQIKRNTIRHKLWRDKNRKHYNEIHRRQSIIRRARKMNADGNYSRDEWETLKAECDYKCLSCGRSEPEIDLTVDHIKPLFIGGTNYIDNIQPLCRSCNSRKSIREVSFA